MLSLIDCNIESHAKLYSISLSWFLVSLSYTVVSPRFSTLLMGSKCSLLCILCRGLVLIMHGLNEHRFVICASSQFRSHHVQFTIKVDLFLKNFLLLATVADTMILQSSWMLMATRFMEWIGLVSPRKIFTCSPLSFTF